MKLWKKWSERSNAILNSAFSNLALLCLSLYRNFFSAVVTALFGDVCRFTPTCSHYAQLSFEQHPPLKASWLTLRRLCKCHPLGSHGYDPVPERKSS